VALQLLHIGHAPEKEQQTVQTSRGRHTTHGAAAQAARAASRNRGVKDEDVMEEDEITMNSTSEKMREQEEGASVTEKEEVSAKESGKLKARPGAVATKGGEPVGAMGKEEPEAANDKSPTKGLPAVIVVSTPIAANKKGEKTNKTTETSENAIDTTMPAASIEHDAIEDSLYGSADVKQSEEAKIMTRPFDASVESRKERSVVDVTPHELTSPEGRTKRSRKQPTLYDPQAGPASRWQTDELQEWKASRAEMSDNDGDDEDKEGTSVAAEASDDVEQTKGTKSDDSSPRSGRKSVRESIDAIWCSFCKDDPNVSVCVFCACRVCFGKHNETKLLLCDKCDEEYHTFCLDPLRSSTL
jgi:hypothetical protein